MASNQTRRQRKRENAMNESDQVQNERISKLEERMLMMEQTIMELRGMTKVLKIVASAVAISLGLDVQAML